MPPSGQGPTLSSGGPSPSVDYQYGFDFVFLRRAQRILKLSLPSFMSWDGLWLVVFVLMVFPPLFTQFLFNLMPGWTMKSLIEMNAPKFVNTMFATALVGMLDAAADGLNFFLSLYLSLRLRNNLTIHLHDRYVNKDLTFYKIARFKGDIDNPDQRIQNDASQVTVGLVTTIAILASTLLSMTIYTIYVTVQVGFHATLIIYAYYILTGLVNKMLMSPIVALTYNQDKLEGNFRYNHVRLRTYAEAVAFLGGEREEHQALTRDLTLALSNQLKLIFRQSALNLFTSLLGNSNSILGYCIVAFGLFHGGKMVSPQMDSPGAMAEKITQLVSIINSLTSCFSTLVSAAQLAASLAGNVSRVGQLLEGMDELQQDPDHNTFRSAAAKGRSIPPRPEKDGVLIKMDDVCFQLNDIARVDNLNFELRRGTNVVITGASGVGKTTLLRCVRGLWKYQGSITVSIHYGPGGIFFCPQKPYMFLGTLAAQITYPRDEIHEEDGQHDNQMAMVRLLDALDLSHLHKNSRDWSATRVWEDVLSQGEQQRLGFVRMMYHRPVLAILDESTSAMGIEMEAKCYKMAKEMGVTLLSVAHRPTALQFHEWSLELEGHGAWAMRPLYANRD